MKTLLKVLFQYTIDIFSLVYSFNGKRFIKKYKNIFYSSWVEKSIKKCGNGFYIQSPAYIKGGQYMTIGERFGALGQLRIECWDEFGGRKFTPTLIIGNDVSMNFNIHIGCINMVSIGDNVLFASNIFITDHQHGSINNEDLGIPPSKRLLNSSGPVIIHDNVWIGENVTILPNVTIGEGCIIGANSVVTKSFSKNSVLAGVPAKLLKTINNLND